MITDFAQRLAEIAAQHSLVNVPSLAERFRREMEKLAAEEEADLAECEGN